MRPRAALLVLAPLFEDVSFTGRDARARGISTALLAHYVNRGDIERIGRGVYRAIDAPQMDNFRWEDLGVAVQKTKDGVICLVSALALHGFPEEVPRQHWIAVHNSTRHRTSSETKVVRMRNMELGKTTIQIGEISLPIFDRERTIVDTFRYLSKETAIKALRWGVAQSGSKKIDVQKLRTYAKKLRVSIEDYLLAVTT